MSNSTGRNPMDWDCFTRGCFNIKKRPKIEEFCECFPRRCSFGDVDGIIELGGSLCFLEWKSLGADLKTGQLMTFTAITQQNEKNIVFVVFGDPETMEVFGFQIIRNGRVSAPIVAGIDVLKTELKNWADLVEPPGDCRLSG